MQRLLVALGFAVCICSVGCRSSRTAASAAPSASAEGTAAAAEPARQPKKSIDSGAVPATAERDKFAAATVVLRVQLVSAAGGSKYHWDRVQPLQVLKNDSESAFDKPFEVAHYGWNKGVPKGTSTIYLERYGEDHKRWRLLGSDGALGVSHVQSP